MSSAWSEMAIPESVSLAADGDYTVASAGLRWQCLTARLHQPLSYTAHILGLLLSDIFRLRRTE